MVEVEVIFLVGEEWKTGELIDEFSKCKKLTLQGLIISWR